VLGPTLSLVTRLPQALVASALVRAVEALRMAALGTAVLVAAGLALALLRRRLLAGRAVEETVTWDCGYAAPSPRMQYTASSFAQPLTFLFRTLLGTHTRGGSPAGAFPGPVIFATHTPDRVREMLFAPAFRLVEALLGRLRVLQHGRIQLYVLSIVLTLIVLILWKLG
jgi:hypothetical protein